MSSNTDSTLVSCHPCLCVCMCILCLPCVLSLFLLFFDLFLFLSFPLFSVHLLPSLFIFSVNFPLPLFLFSLSFFIFFCLFTLPVPCITLYPCSLLSTLLSCSSSIFFIFVLPYSYTCFVSWPLMITFSFVLFLLTSLSLLSPIVPSPIQFHLTFPLL